MRQAIARAIAARCTRAELAVLLAVLSFTGAWTRFLDRRALERVAELAGVHPKTAASALWKLRRCRAIVYRPGSGRPGEGRGIVSLIGLRKVRPERGAPEDSPFAAKRGASGDSGFPRKGEPFDPERGASGGSPHELSEVKTVVVDDDEQEQLRRALEPLGSVDADVLRKVLTPWRADPGRIARCARAARKNGRTNPVGLFLTMLERGDDPSENDDPGPPGRKATPENPL